MTQNDGSDHRLRYTVECKLKAIRLVEVGQNAPLTARVLGMPKQTLRNCVGLPVKNTVHPFCSRLRCPRSKH